MNETRHARLVVFGSVAAARPPATPAVGAVLERVYDSIAASAPAIAAPIIDRAVDEGRITRVERHELLRELRDPGTVDFSHGARSVLREALAAVRRAAPAIAMPILDDAVDQERLTAAQERRILERLRISPATALRAATAQPAGSVS